MTLTKTIISKEYTIETIKANDPSMENFLFSLGCYPGERISVISKLSSNYIISVKGTRYSVDETLAKTINVI